MTAIPRRRVRLVLGTMLAVLLAVPHGSPTAVAGAPQPLRFTAPVVLPGSSDVTKTLTDLVDQKTCNLACGEPLLAVAPDGTLWISSTRGLLVCCNTKTSPLWKSTDGGATWQGPIHPPSPAGAWNALSGGDTSIVIDKRNTVYVQELWAANDSMFISEDAGASWISSPAHHAGRLVDRPWLAYSGPDDVIYAYYEDYDDYLLARADVGGPLGSKAALFFQPLGSVATAWQACVPAGDRPCLYDDVLGHPGAVTGPPARPAVDQRDGTLYVPVSYYRLGEGIIVATSTDRGETFHYAKVPGAGREPGQYDQAWTFHNFIVSAVDAGGNAYVAWSEHVEGEWTVHYSVSTDQGRTWTSPRAVSGGISATAVLPAIAAGAAGQVAIGWYGSEGYRGDPNDAPAGTSWEVDIAVSSNALSESPHFEVARLDTGFHHGSIWTVTKGSGDRRLLDFFDIQVEPSTGALVVTYARDKGEGTELVFVRQVE